MMPDVLILLPVALPFAGAVAAGLLPTHARDAAALLAGAVALASLAVVWILYPTILTGGIAAIHSGWKL